MGTAATRGSLWLRGLLVAVLLIAALTLLRLWSPGSELSGESAGIGLPGGSQTPDILLISIDTLRSDHLGSYGYARATSPGMDGLARDGVLFRQALVPMPKTTPSLASLLSGLHPKSHGTFRLGFPVDPAIPFLAQLLKNEGYATGGVCGQYNCSSKFGFGRGFDFFEDRFGAPVRVGQLPARTGGGFQPGSEKRAGEIVDEALGWLEQQRDAAPFFLWLHFMDPHAGYAAPAPYSQQFSGPSPLSGNSFTGPKVPLDLIQPQALVEGINDYDYYLNQYDAEIRYLDDQLDRLIQHLKEQELYRNMLIILTADHGEYMGESSDRFVVFHHGDTLYESEVRVPLIVKLPQNRFAGTGNDGLVSVVDIVPTVMSVLGKEVPHAEGISLLPAILQRGEEPFSRRLFLQLPGDMAVFAVRSEGRKVVLATRRSARELIDNLRAGGRANLGAEVYDLVADPLERVKVTENHPALVQDAMSRLNEWLAEPAVHGVAATPPGADEETLEHLRSLGYVQ